jgi:hypothetical protein
MERWLIAVGVALFVLVLVLVAAGYLATMGVVGRHIASAFKAVPTDYGLKSEVISFRSTDRVDLKGWWIPAQGTPRGTVILANLNMLSYYTHGFKADKLEAQGAVWESSFGGQIGSWNRQAKPQPPQAIKINGRHEETRTPDLYRVNLARTGFTTT